MLTNDIPFDQIGNGKTWYKIIGVDESNEPIIEKLPYNHGGCIFNSPHPHFSDNKEELRKYWINIKSKVSQYEKINTLYKEKFLKLQKKIKKDKNIDICDFNRQCAADRGIPLISYYLAQNYLGNISETEAICNILGNIDAILDFLKKGLVIQNSRLECARIITNREYDRKTKTIKINTIYLPLDICNEIDFREVKECEDTCDLSTIHGLYSLGLLLHGNWWELKLDDIIEEYHEFKKATQKSLKILKKLEGIDNLY